MRLAKLIFCPLAEIPCSEWLRPGHGRCLALLALDQELFAQRFAQCRQLRLDIPDFFVRVQQRVLRADRLRVGIAKERLGSVEFVRRRSTV